MPTIKIQDLTKTYEAIKALDDLSITIEDRSFVVILGASGSGKTTLLRIISGLEEADEGDLSFNDTSMNGVDARERDVALVFQKYNLYPQMSVYQNIALPLKTKLIEVEAKDRHGNPLLEPDWEAIDNLKEEFSLLPKADKKAKRKEYKEKIKSLKKNPTIPVKSFEHIANEEIERRVVDVASFLGLSDLLKRNPSTLSGGQKQRVALAKAMVREPKVLLLDEPLSSLDQKLRKEARELIKKVHLKAGCTTVMVSHDQEDASLADVVMIMKEGKIEQIGSVQEIYEKPNSLYCASFFGKPSINVLPDECLDLLGIKGDVITAIRAEDIKIEETKESGVTYIEMDVTTTKEELLGHDKIIYFSINGSDCCLKASRNIKKEPNEPMRIYIDSRKVHIFSKTTGVRL